MNNVLQIPVRPGGMLSDVVKTEMGGHQHQEVKNLKQNKSGLWECVDGYIDLFENGSYNDLTASIEIYDEYSGDRFILFQHGIGLYRLDYNAGIGNGYENEEPAAVSLPSGVTIGGSAVLRFFYFRGVVRITGASDPLWYSYVDRTLFEDAWEEIYRGGFETDTESWTGSSATVSQYDCDADADGSGMWGAPEQQYGLKVVQNPANTGVAKRSFIIESGKTIRFWGMFYRASGGTGNITIKLGSSDGGSEYGTLTSTTEDAWTELTAEFTSTGTTLYVELMPSDGAANDTAYFDFILIEECCPVTIQDWVMEKAELMSQELQLDNVFDPDRDSDTGKKAVFGKAFTKYDNAQFCLMGNLNNQFSAPPYQFTAIDSEIGSLEYHTDGFVRGFDFELNGSDLENSFPNKRMTDFGFAFAVHELESLPIDDSELVFYVSRILSLINGVETFSFHRENYYYDNVELNRIYFVTGDATAPSEVDGFFRVGLRIFIHGTTGAGIDTIITEVNDAYFEIAHKIHGNLVGGAIAQSFDADVQVEKKWVYDASNGYNTRVGVDLDRQVNEFYGFVDIPSGTSDIAPDYTHHVVIEDRAYVNSGEDEEEDTVRYSSLEMFDCFPNGNLIQTEVGDVDQIKAIVKRGNRLVMLKRNSFSQGNFSGGRYYEDIGIRQQGLFGDSLFIVVDDVLYFGDEQDVFAWNGVQAVPLLNNLKMKEFYKAYVDANSLILYNKLNNELWFILKGGASDQVLVFDIDKGE